MVLISEVSYRKSIEMDVDMALELDDENMVVNMSPKVAMVGKVIKPAKSPRAARKTAPPKKKDGVKKEAMKAKAKPKAKTVESKTKGMTTAEMVSVALVNLKSRKGITLASIRNYVHKNYGVQGKQRDELIKDALRELFENGDLGNLEPSKDGELKFNNRFWFKPKN